MSGEHFRGIEGLFLERRESLLGVNHTAGVASEHFFPVEIRRSELFIDHACVAVQNVVVLNERAGYTRVGVGLPPLVVEKRLLKVRVLERNTGHLRNAGGNHLIFFESELVCLEDIADVGLDRKGTRKVVVRNEAVFAPETFIEVSRLAVGVGGNSGVCYEITQNFAPSSHWILVVRRLTRSHATAALQPLACFAYQTNRVYRVVLGAPSRSGLAFAFCLGEIDLLRPEARHTAVA